MQEFINALVNQIRQRQDALDNCKPEQTDGIIEEIINLKSALQSNLELQKEANAKKISPPEWSKTMEAKINILPNNVSFYVEPSNQDWLGVIVHPLERGENYSHDAHRIHIYDASDGLQPEPVNPKVQRNLDVSMQQPIIFQMNIDFLIDALAGMDGCITVRYAGPTKPVLFTDSYDRAAVIMPMYKELPPEETNALSVKDLLKKIKEKQARLEKRRDEISQKVFSILNSSSETIGTGAKLHAAQNCTPEELAMIRDLGTAQAVILEILEDEEAKAKNEHKN